MRRFRGALAWMVLLAMPVRAGVPVYQAPADLTGRWVLDPTMVARDRPRPLICGFECSIVQRDRAVLVTIQKDTKTFAGDGSSTTDSYRSPQGYVADQTITSSWEGPVFVIQSVSSSPQSSKKTTTVVKLSLVDGDLVTEGTRPLITGPESFRFVYHRCLVEPPKPCR